MVVAVEMEIADVFEKYVADRIAKSWRWARCGHEVVGGIRITPRGPLWSSLGSI